jgi:membrane-bound inhibitor of C-type lysozyme
MNRIVQRALAALALAATLSCSPATVGESQEWLTFRCPDGQSVRVRFEEKAQFAGLELYSKKLRLPRAISGSGARYSDGKTTFWNRGDSALVEVDEKIVLRDCMLQRGS